MKKLFLFPLVVGAILAEDVQAQSTSTKVESIIKIEKQPTVLKKKNRAEILAKQKPFAIRNNQKSVTFKSYLTSQFEDNSFSIQNHPDSTFKFEIIFNENESHGYAYEENAATGFAINSIADSLTIKELPIGEIIFQCTSEKDQNDSYEEIQHEVNTPPVFIGNYATETDVYKLQSKPGAPTCIYLDFDGEDIGKWGWQYVATTITISNNMVKKIWESAAMDFLPFNVNVTTSLDVFHSYPTTKRIMQVFMDYNSPSWLGIAALNSFGGKPCLVHVTNNPTEAYDYLFRTPSHELGHTMGLSHDGTTAGIDYYLGHGEYTPIMGSGPRVFSLWSKGEYAMANNQEDDFAMITTKLGTRPDDNAQTRYITYTSAGSILNGENSGMLENENDVDEWNFVLSATGNVNITVDPIFKFTDLDVLLIVEDQNGNQIASINPTGSRLANFNQSLSAGTYKLKIKAGSELTPSTGWSTYAVFGYYEIYGNVEKPVLPAVDLKVLPLNVSTPFCQSTTDYNLALEVQNNGTQDVAAIDINIYVDGVLSNTFNESTLLAAGTKNTYNLTFALPTGVHTIKVQVSDPQNGEVNLSNNDVSFSSNLKIGDRYNFSTNYPLYYKNALSWTIKNTATNVNVGANNSIRSQTGYLVNHEVCLDKGACFDFTITGSLKSCNPSYPQWQQGANYTAPNRVVYNHSVYEAKWWTANPTSSADWKKIEDCSSSPSFFRIYNSDFSDTLVNLTNTTYVSAKAISFCSSLTTDVVEFTAQNLKLYPNPAHDMITLEGTAAFQNIRLYNAMGQLIQVYQTNQNIYSINTSSLSQGIYFLQTNNDFVKFIKQ
jgi:hypothetical protein